jgi:hypothetical protein
MKWATRQSEPLLDGTDELFPREVLLGREPA